MKVQDYWNYEDEDDYTQGIVPIAKKAQKKQNIAKIKHKRDSRKIARKDKMRRQEEEL